jgi:gliding motility-associated-like protein
MKNNSKSFLFLFIAIIALSIKSFGQNEPKLNFYPYVFNQDSLVGFNEMASRSEALSKFLHGDELKFYLMRAKRQFINAKYNITCDQQFVVQKNEPLPNTTLNNANKTATSSGACNNEDFEDATTGQINGGPVNGWSFYGANTGANFCTAPVATGATTNYVIFNGTAVDPIMGNITSYFDASTPFVQPSGTCFARLNNSSAGAKIVRMEKTFVVTSTNSLFRYAYRYAFENAGHDACGQPGIKITVSITNTVTNTSTVLACPNVSIAAGASTVNTTSSGGVEYNTQWIPSAIDLSSLIGSQITINLSIYDCAYGGHWGYVYFDAQCGPMTILGNLQPYVAGSGTVSVPTCGAMGATITAPGGMGPYSWQSSQVTLPINLTIPSFTNQTFTTNVSATYTLSMNPPGACAPITRIVQSTISAAPALNISAVQALCGGTSAIVNVIPGGSITSPTLLAWVPTPTVLGTNSTQATYTLPPGPAPITVSVSTQDNVGCKLTVTINVNPAPPTPTFGFQNSSPNFSLTCFNPVMTLTATSNYFYQGVSLSYNWTSPILTSTDNAITTATPAVFIVSATDPVTQCFTTKTLTVFVDKVVPTAAVTPSNIPITCANALNQSSFAVVNVSSPTVNIKTYITNPLGGTLITTASNYSVPLGSPGFYTVVVVNETNGCSTTKGFTVTSNQTFPSFSVQSTSNYTLGCASTSLSTISFVNPQGGTPGASVTYTLLGPNTSSTIPNTNPLSNISVYTVNTAGGYTLVANENVNGCKAILPITILDNKFGPTIDSLIVPTTILDCNTPSITLKAFSLTDTVSYRWSFNLTGGNFNASTVVVQSNTAAPNSTVVNTYTCFITDENNKCVTPTVVPIYQCLFAPTASITGKNEITCVETEIVLNNNSSTRIPSLSIFPNGNAIGHIWKGPSPQVDLNTSSSYTAKVSGTYTLIAKDLGNGCLSLANFTVIDNTKKPEVTPKAVNFLDCGSKSVVVCSGTTLTPALFDWERPPGTSAASSNTNDCFSAEVPGIYFVTVLDPGNGCATTKSMVVKSGSLTPSVEASQISGFAPLTVVFTNNSTSSTGNSSITSIWDFGNGKDLTTKSASIAPSNIYTLPGTYNVKVYITKGSGKATCLDSVVNLKINVEIPSVFEIPNVFTPNKDGINDFFFLKTANLETIDATIFDRWGRMVFKTEGSTTGNISWDGTNASGKDCPDGTYFYIIKAKGKDGKEYDQKGNLSLYR